MPPISPPDAALTQTTIARSFTVRGPGLHTGRRTTLTLHPAAADYGRRVTASERGEPRPAPVPMTWAHRVPSVMSTSIDLGDGRAVRTIEHLMAALSAYGVDNVSVEMDGFEVPILDGSAAPWCRRLDAVGLRALPAPRRAIRIRKPVQIVREGGFLRAEPGEGSTLDVTYGLLFGWPFMRWTGSVDRETFRRDLARSRSFGLLDWRGLLGRARPARPPGNPPVVPHAPDPAFDPEAPRHLWTRLEAQKASQTGRPPLLRGARPGRVALVAGRYILGGARYPGEPMRHVALDMVGDLALAGLPLLGRIVAHNPSHEKTYMLVVALMDDPDAWEIVEARGPGASPAVGDACHQTR